MTSEGVLSITDQSACQNMREKEGSRGLKSCQGLDEAKQLCRELDGEVSQFSGSRNEQ